MLTLSQIQLQFDLYKVLLSFPAYLINTVHYCIIQNCLCIPIQALPWVKVCIMC